MAQNTISPIPLSYSSNNDSVKFTDLKNDPNMSTNRVLSDVYKPKSKNNAALLQDYLTIDPNRITRSVSSNAFTDLSEDGRTSPILDKNFTLSEEKTLVERPKSRRMVPLMNSGDVVEISQSKEFHDDFQPKSTNATAGVLSQRMDYIEENVTPNKQTIVERKEVGNPERSPFKSKPSDSSNPTKKSSGRLSDGPKGYKKKFSIMKEKQPDNVNVTPLEQDLLASPTKYTSMYPMECKGDKSSNRSGRTSMSRRSFGRETVEVLGLKARICELEQIIEELKNPNSVVLTSPRQTTQPPNSRQPPRLPQQQKQTFLGISFRKKKAPPKRKLVRSESERDIRVESKVATTSFTPQILQTNANNSSELSIDDSLPLIESVANSSHISNEEYRKEVIRLNKEIVHFQQLNNQKDAQIQALASEQMFFSPLLTLQELKEFHDGVANDSVDVILSLLQNKPLEIQQKYLGYLNDCAEVRFTPETKLIKDKNQKDFQFTTPIIRPRSPVHPCILPNMADDPVRPQEELYRCLCDSFVTRQEEYYYLFQVVSYLYLAPLRQQGIPIVSKVDRIFPEIMMIERTLLRNMPKGFIDALAEYTTKLRIYIPFILMKDKTKRKLCLELESDVMKEILKDKTVEFHKKYGTKVDIPSLDVCIDRISQRITEICRFFEDILKQIVQSAALAMNSEQALKDSIVQLLEFQDLKVVEKKFLTTSHKINDGSRRIRYFGGLKFVSPGESPKDWKMCFLCNDVLIIARPFAFGKSTIKEREIALRFENAPSGRDVGDLAGYRFNEEERVILRAPVILMNIVDKGLVHNAFMLECMGIRKHCCCVSIKERDFWVEALSELNGD
ncbi:DH domain-containing protein [Entamoeba marina]